MSTDLVCACQVPYITVTTATNVNRPCVCVSGAIYNSDQGDKCQQTLCVCVCVSGAIYNSDQGDKCQQTLCVCVRCHI